jgi:diguanylate cyclase (GGDEF)-like protein/PAS domain S-box-containing protein
MNNQTLLKDFFEHLFDKDISKHINSDPFYGELQFISFLDTMINSTIEGIIVFDQNRRCIRANNPACYIFGYRPEEMIGKYAYEFVSEASVSLVKNKIKMHDQAPYEAVMIKKDGSEFPALLRGKDLTINNKTIRISAVMDLSEIKAKEKEIYTVAYFDKLTGLPNRLKMIEDMNSRPVHACVIFNIDKFGQINDLFGSETGDRLLVKFARELEKENIHPYRIGGDEFAVLFDKTMTYQKLEQFILRCIEKIEKLEFLAEDEPFHIHIRAGAAINRHKLLTHADIAVREAKQRKVPFFIYDQSKNIEAEYKKNLNMTIAIHKALENKGIICYYQPIFDRNLKIAKYETLVRMKDDSGRIFLPGEFLSIAKTTKLYPEITKEVIRQACEKFSGRDIEFNVNISIDDIENDELIEYATDIIKTTGTGGKIGFEILETEGIQNYDVVKNFMNKIEKMGAKVAIDDFGSGYSNFRHILSLNIDCIKIDGSLIRDINKNRRNLIIVETIVEFAKKINAKTVAEFVCSKEVYDAIKNLDIDFYQGFYLAEPKPELQG